MIIQLLFLFMIYSLIGWLWETPYVSVNEKKYINRGFLRGPYIPIYGFACLTIIISMTIFENYDQNNIFIIITQIIFISSVSAFWEYFTSLGLELAFKTRWWDYSNRKFNLSGRIALDYTILFGVGGYLLWRFLNPLVLGAFDYLSYDILFTIILIFYSIFIVDYIYTFRDLFKLRSIVLKLNVLRNEFSNKYEYIFDYVYNGIQSRKEDFISKVLEFKKIIGKELTNIRDKGEGKLAKSLENKVFQLNQILMSSKSLSRFYNKFPKASSKKYENLSRDIKQKEESNNK